MAANPLNPGLMESYVGVRSPIISATPSNSIIFGMEYWISDTKPILTYDYDPGVISGTTAGIATATGTIEGLGDVVGTIAGVNTSTATIEGLGDMTGESDGVATATAGVTGTSYISGTIPGASSPSADIEGIGDISGSTPGVSINSGVLLGYGRSVSDTPVANAVTFHLFDMNDDIDALTLEGVYQKYAGFAGVQSFDFSDDITGFVSSKWTAGLTGISYTNNTIVTNGSSGSEQIAWYLSDMPHSYSFEFFAHAPIWGVAVRGDGAINYYRIYYDYSYIYVYKVVLGSLQPYLIKQLHGNEITSFGKVKISVRDAQFSADSGGRIIYLSIWIDDQLVLSFSDNVQTVIPPLRFGFIIPVSSAKTYYSDLRVANLGEVIIWSSLDPGEYPQGAIQRAIEDRYIRSWIRWDGSLRAWKPQARTLYQTLSASKDFNSTVTLDTKQIFSHVRMLGAFQWVQVSDPDLERRFGHRFREVNNTSLWNADDCLRVAQQLLMRSKEQANQASIATYGLIFSEIEDRIQIPDVKIPANYIDYIIDNVSWDMEPGTFRAQVNVRQYFYGEP